MACECDRNSDDSAGVTYVWASLLWSRLIWRTADPCWSPWKTWVVPSLLLFPPAIVRASFSTARKMGVKQLSAISAPFHMWVTILGFCFLVMKE